MNFPTITAEALAQTLGKFTTKSGGGFMACCPAHEDKNPSLSVDDGADGKPLFFCFAGCSQEAVMAALQARGHWPSKDDTPEPAQKIKQKVVARRDYHNESGNLLYWKERLEPGRNGKKDFRFRHKDPETGENAFGHGKHNPHVIYNLPKVLKTKSIIFVEGEELVDLLAEMGLVGTSLDTGAKSLLTPEQVAQLSGKRIVILRDNDIPGLTYAVNAANDLYGKVESLKVILLPDLDDKGDLKDWLQIPGNDKTRLLEIIKSTPEWEKQTPSEALEEANGGESIGEDADSTSYCSVEQAKKHFPVIPFPAEILPGYMQNLVERYSKALQCQYSFMAMTFLTVISGAAGNSVRLAIKNSWKTALFLWLGIIDKSGAGKSHPLEAAMDPLIHLQSVETARYEKEMEQYKLDEVAYRKSKLDCEPPPEPEPMRHYFSNNFTVESLIAMYKRTARGIVVFVDELAGLLKGLNQYKGGKGSDDEQFLSLFNCGALKSDRVAKSGFCRESGAAVIGGIQPGVYAGVFGDKEAANGMLYRWLPLVMNVSPPNFSDDDLTQGDQEKWENILSWMYEIPAETDPETGFIKKAILTVEPAGREIWRQFHDELSHIQPFMPERFQGYLPKLKTYCLKFMGLLHLLECYQANTLCLTVNKTTVEHAILLTRYFAGQALQLTSEPAGTTDPFHAALQKAIESLRGEADKSGRLPLSRIRERMNELLPPDMEIEVTQNKRVATWLKEIGINVTVGAANKSFVVIK